MHRLASDLLIKGVKPFRHTRITFTIGPATESEAQLEAIIKAGANVVRLNMAHADHAWVRTIVARVRDVSGRLKKELAVMMDIKGPEIRTGARKEAAQLAIDQLVDVTGSETAQAEGDILVIPTNYPKMITAVPVGGVVLVDNGLIQLRVLEQKKDRLRCKVEQPGPLGSRRHINLPGVKVDLPALTDKDRTDLAFGLQHGVDWVALSFVRNPSDMLEIKELIATRVRPAVANDGGDIIFKRFDKDTGIVYLAMRGACSGCPSSAMTLKSGVENLLRHYVPEVTAVEAAA